MKPRSKAIDVAAQWADELGHLQAELAPFRDKIAREAKLKSLLREQADLDGVAATVGTIYCGQHYTASVGAKSEERGFDLAKLYRIAKLKPAEFLAHCSMTLKNAETILEKLWPEQRKDVITKAPTGSRKISTYANRAA